MRAAVILTAALVLAGCIGSGAQDPLEGPADSGGQAPEPTASDEPVPPPQATFTFVEDFEMQLQSGAGGANGDNCVIFPDDLRILRGNATVTWLNPAVPDLTFSIKVHVGNNQFERPLSQRGASPLRADFGELPQGIALSPRVDWGTFFQVNQGSVPSALVDFALHLEFDYEAAAVVQPTIEGASCG